MKTVRYKDYTIGRLESGTIEVQKDGHIISPTLPLLREFAQELNVSIENASGNLHITRQLGVLVMRAIEKQSNLNIPSDGEINVPIPTNNKFYSKDLENKISHTTSFLKKMKQTIHRIQKPSILTIEDLIDEYIHENKYGLFYLDKGERIENVLVENTVPNEYGVWNDPKKLDKK